MGLLSKLWVLRLLLTCLSASLITGVITGMVDGVVEICSAAHAEPQRGQARKIKFEKKKLVLETTQLTVEVADTDEKQELGLMFRKKLGLGEGMLFIFTDERPRAFWMKNTFLDLDIGFFDKKKKLIDIQTMAAMKSVMDKDLPSYTSTGPAQYALEVSKGWFEKNKIKVGTTFNLQ